MSAVVVIGIGNTFRGDDAAGIEVARMLRDLVPTEVKVLEHDGEPISLLDAWEGASTAYVIDAVRAQDPTGTLHRIEIREGALVPSSPRRDSSHALGLGEAVSLARALERLPERLVLIGITGEAFEAGDALSDTVRGAVERVAREVGEEVRALCA
jgi:hydrogenase maturation protease